MVASTGVYAGLTRRPGIPQPHAGQIPAPHLTCPTGQAPYWDASANQWICAPSTTMSWSTMTFAQKFESIAFLVTFGLIFLTIAIGAAVFGSP